ncbi:MAG: MarC family protein [Sandaracinus sp.]|nr:MarC family protein [Sandaracinus sp.]MCB9635000.1 MarC family protein [Sandaracinus sp.]
MSWTSFLGVFVPLLAITNVLPVLPVTLSILEDVPESERPQATRRALTTVLVVGISVAIAGGALLRWWGLTTEDLRIAGGLVLLIFAIHDLLFSQMERKSRAKALDESIDDDLGNAHELSIVPLGVPILLGPAGMTALLVFGETRGIVPTLLAFLANFAINAALLLNAGLVRRVFGRAVVRATGKVMSLVLAALAVSMLRTGIEATLGG